MGRPSKLTPQIQERIVLAVRAGNYASVAARSAGIGESTFYRWMENGAKDDAPTELREFREAIKKAEADAEVSAALLIRQAAQNGTWQAAAWYLERKYADRWGRNDKIRQEIEVTTNDPSSIDSEVARLVALLDSSQKGSLDASVSAD